MAKRKVIKIDQVKCNGCAQCIPNCPEGAIQIIDGKARLISDLFCDGLGACIGHCPQGAITIEEREAKEYSERKVIENIVKQGKNVIIAHLEHLKSHQQQEYLKEALNYLKEKGIEVSIPRAEQEGTSWPSGLLSVASHGTALREDSHNHHGCPSAMAIDFHKERGGGALVQTASQLRHWPVQIKLVPPVASFLNNTDLLIAADCVPFAYADFHQDLLKDKTLLVGCPKLDDLALYKEKITQVLKHNNIKSVTYAHMEVPCCFGLVSVIKEAILESAKVIPFKEVVITIKGERLG